MKGGFKKMKKHTCIQWFRILTVLAGVIGLCYQLLPDKWEKFTYYTLLSNAVVVLFMSYTVWCMLTKRDEVLDSPVFLRLKGGVTIAITLTFLVYAILLAPKAKPEDFYHIKNYTLHYAVPIMVIVDWLFFDKPNAYRVGDPIRWTIFPLLYCVVALIKGYVFQIPISDEPNSPYPYFFLNVEKIGWSGFFMYFTAILVGYVVLGYIMYIVKRRKKAV